MTYNFRSVVNHVLRKTEFGPVSESVDSQFAGDYIDPLVDRVKDWVNEVYLEICNTGYWRFLEAEGSFQTQAGQESYSLASNCKPNRIIDVRETATPALLKRVDFKSIDRLYPDTTKVSRGTPYYYYFINDLLYLFPQPAEQITVKYRYYKIVTELENATDVPVIPEHWRWVWVNGVLLRANQYLQDQSTQEAYMLYSTGLQHMRAENRADRQQKNFIKPE